MQSKSSSVRIKRIVKICTNCSTSSSRYACRCSRAMRSASCSTRAISTSASSSGPSAAHPRNVIMSYKRNTLTCVTHITLQQHFLLLLLVLVQHHLPISNNECSRRWNNTWLLTEILRSLIVNVQFVRNGRPLFYSTQMAEYVGIINTLASRYLQ